MFLLKQRGLYGTLIIYKEPIEKGLIGYAGQLGKDVDDLTDEEIRYVVEKVAEIASEVGTNVIMQDQQVPELFGVSAKHKIAFQESVSQNYPINHGTIKTRKSRVVHTNLIKIWYIL